MGANSSFWMEHVESMPKILCPRCKSENVLRRKADKKNSRPPFSWFRVRFCRQCRYRWSAFSQWIADLFSRRSPLWRFFLVLVFISGIGAIVYFVLNTPDPAHFFKTMVVDAYDNTYGAESRKKLWLDWNWLYRKKRVPAEEDYHSHRTQE